MLAWLAWLLSVLTAVDCHRLQLSARRNTARASAEVTSASSSTCQGLIGTTVAECNDTHDEKEELEWWSKDATMADRARRARSTQVDISALISRQQVRGAKCIGRWGGAEAFSRCMALVPVASSHSKRMAVRAHRVGGLHVVFRAFTCRLLEV